MTLPDERYRAVKYARELLRDLLDPKRSPKVPKAIRQRAARVLKHFPTECDMFLTARKLTNIFEVDPKDKE